MLSAVCEILRRGQHQELDRRGVVEGVVGLFVVVCVYFEVKIKVRIFANCGGEEGSGQKGVEMVSHGHKAC